MRRILLRFYRFIKLIVTNHQNTDEYNILFNSFVFLRRNRDKLFIIYLFIDTLFNKYILNVIRKLLIINS